MESVPLPFGRTSIECPIPRGAEVQLLRAQESRPLDPASALLGAVEHPIGGLPLSRLAETGGPVAIVVPDKSRRCPTAELLPPLLDHLARRGAGPVTILVAHALHRPHPAREIGLDQDIFRGVRALSHGVPPARFLVTIGTIPVCGRAGRKPIRINAIVAQARLVIALGTIAPHPMAGFSGGAKAIIPGVAGAGTIALNHALMLHPKARWGILHGNPLREDIERAARLLPHVFCINAIYDAGRRVVGLVAGDMVAAHRAGVHVARAIGEISARRADLVIAGAGLPETLNAFQALKLVVPASTVVKPGGAIVIAAECPEGPGELKPVSRLMFDLLTRRNLPPGVAVYLYSGFPGPLRLPSFVRRVERLDEAVDREWPKTVPRARLAIMSGADLLLPRPTGG